MAIKSHQFILFIIVPVLLLSPATGQPSPPDSDVFGNGYNNINPSIGIIIIVLVASLFLLAFFSMYIRHCSSDSPSDAALRLSANQPNRSRTAPRGLDASVIESFPTFDYSSVKSLHIGKGALECAVCLNEFEDNETLRLIPKCDHVFHPDCIDTWLISHTTCPVCRAELTPQPGESLHAPILGQIPEAVIDVVACETEAMDRPVELPPPGPMLNRSRTHRHASGRPRWLAVFARSNSTGHVALRQQGENNNNNVERFTLRLPEDVRRQIMSGQLTRTTSCVALPTEGSSQRGYRAGLSGPGGPSREGSSRGRMLGSWAGRSDRWGFSMAPPFFTRGPSVRSPKVADAGGGDYGSSVHSSKAGDSVRGSTNLPPV